MAEAQGFLYLRVCGWRHRAGNGSPFTHCQILPKVADGGRQLGRRKEEGEEAKMMERPTSGRKEGREFKDDLAPNAEEYVILFPNGDGR